MTNTDRSSWSIWDINGIDKNIDKQDTPYVSPTPGKLPRIALHPVPTNLMELVHSDPASYRATLLKIMNYVSATGCNAIMIGGTFEQLDANLQAVEDLANGILITDPIYPADTAVSGSKDAIPAAGGIIGPIIPPPAVIGGPELGVMIQTAWLYDSLEHCAHIVSNYKDNRFVKGWMIMDQPHYWDWGNVVLDDTEEHTYNRLTVGYKTATSYSKYHLDEKEKGKNYAVMDQLTMFSLPASELREWIGMAESYSKYLWALDRLFKPGVWTYSFFPFTNIISSGIPQTGISTNHNVFYRFLELYRKNAADTGKPFWAYCQVESHQVRDTATGKILYKYPSPDAGMIRFEAFSALAYGAQGLMFSRMGMEKNIDNIERLEDPFSWGKPATGSSAATTILRSDVCGYMKTVNEEIDKCSHIFLGCNCLKTAHTGNLFGQSPAQFPFGCLQCVKADGNGVLLSELQLQDSKATVIVNHDPFHTQKIETTLDDTKKPVLAYPESKHPTSGTVRTLTLDPGGAIIFTYK